jgi:2-dehydropantoate 2-reductase
MRIAVIGAGAMGGVVAALLHRAGHEVEVTARGDGLDAIREHGIRLSGAWGDHVARVSAGPALSATPELAIVATKAMDAAAAVQANAAVLDGVPVVVLQNGMGGLESVAAALPRSSVIGALSLIAATYRAPGEVVVTAPAGTWLGTIEGVGTPADPTTLHRIATTLAMAFPVTLVDDFAGARWTKLLINQLNALPAITGLSVQDVVADAGLRRIMAASMREAARIAIASGIHFVEVNGVTHAQVEALAAGNLAEAESLPWQLRDYLGDVPNPGSTLQSIRRGQASEIDHLNGAVVREGLAAGIQAPVNATLTRLVHDVERMGTHLGIEEAIEALRDAIED